MHKTNTKQGICIFNTITDINQTEITCTKAEKPMTVGGFRWKIRFVGSNQLENFARFRWAIQIVRDGDLSAYGQFPLTGEPFDDGLANIISWGTGYLYSQQRTLQSIIHPDVVDFVVTGWYQDIIIGKTDTKRRLQKGDKLLVTCICNNGSGIMKMDLQWMEWY